MKKLLIAIICSVMSLAIQAQQPLPKIDTVVVNLGKTSKVIFTVRDKEDLEILKHFDFQGLFMDIITKMEKNDTTALRTMTENDSANEEQKEPWEIAEEINNDEEDHDDSDKDRDKKWGKTWQSFNFDLGGNNYLSNGEFPDAENQLYSVRPWGSWYIAFNSIQRTRIVRKLFLEWGLGISWYNFKFQNDNVLLQENGNVAEFTEDGRDVDFIKSKLSVNYLNASLIPVLDFGDKGKKGRMWDGNKNSFRLGFGPYVGYRLGSHSKIVYIEDGDREKDKDRNNFYLQNLRYGWRLQLGFRSTDLFFNYDMNELFTDEKGPSLNAFSFGVVF